MKKNRLNKTTKTSRLRGAILTMMGILAMHGTAHAAIVLTASPGEVTIPLGQATGTTTITYDSGSYDKSQIWMTVDGGAQTLFQDDVNTNKPDKGSKVVTVSPGKTYVFNMYRGLNNQNDSTKLLATTTVTAKQTKIILVPLEPVDFIKDVKVEPHGNFAKFTFTTPRTSLPVVMISTKTPNAPFASFTKQGTTPPAAFNKGDVVSTSFAQIGTNHFADLRNLTPNTTYNYVIEASDKGVGVYRAKGTFTTLKRKVLVKFDSIKVTDDSDSLGEGELSFGFFVNGSNDIGGGKMSFPSSGQIGWSTGDTKNVNITRTLTNAPSKLTLKVTGFDDDEFESPFTLSTCGLGTISDPNMSQNGENSCGEWTSTSASFDLENTDPEDKHPTVPFTLVGSRGGKSELAFEVRGSYTVSYSK